MKGRTVEMELAKGWGRVGLSNGRILPFDSAACREGIPDRGAEVAVDVEWRFFGPDKTHPAPPSVRPPNGTTGYATLEVRRGTKGLLPLAEWAGLEG